MNKRMFNRILLVTSLIGYFHNYCISSCIQAHLIFYAIYMEK